MNTPVNPSFTILKLGVRGSTLQGHAIMMLHSLKEYFASHPNKCLILCSQIYNFTTHDACANQSCNYIESNAYFALKYFMIE